MIHSTAMKEKIGLFDVFENDREEAILKNERVPYETEIDLLREKGGIKYLYRDSETSRNDMLPIRCVK